MAANPQRNRPRHSILAGAGMLLLGVAGACSNNDSADAAASVPPIPSTPNALARGDDAPGIALQVVSLKGASGADGTFRVGDHVVVTFTAKKKDGSNWLLGDFASGRIMLSGPTVNYQRVIPEQQDLLTASVLNSDSSYTYTFAAGIPDVFAPPLNDTPTFNATDGELQGQTLVAGTYTVGMYVSWDYTVDGDPFRDAGDATADFLFDGAAPLTSREVVAQANCNQCHSSLRAHGGSRRSVKLCLLCHTSGAEDKNVATVAGGTPDVTIDFRVMIHRIHNGAHLPSVLGVASNPDGSRNYGATPRPYQVVGFQNSINDFSDVNFPAWPAGMTATPRDLGYSALTATQQATEDEIRTGVTTCAACHGDPDGNGPLAAPAQGEVAYAQPSRRACGSCHDDLDWHRPYISNGATMPPQDDDSACLLCHGAGSSIAPAVAHRHPLFDPSFNSGTNVAVTRVAEAGAHNNSGTIDPGEKIAVTFRAMDDAGFELAAASLASVSVILSGPTVNSNLLLNGSIPVAALTGSQPWTVNVPQAIALEYVGDATATLGDTFTTARTPHWDVSGAVTNVFARTATGGGTSTTSGVAVAPRNFLDVADATGFARNDFVVVDDGVAGQVEYLQIGWVEGNRLWFPSTVVSRNHAANATVREVTLTQKTRGTQYALAAATGLITEVAEFGAGNAVVVSYTTDYVLPTRFPLELNDSPTLTETAGKWTGKPIVDGTYALTLYASRSLTLDLFGETNSYRSTAKGVRAEFLVGAATQLEPYALIASGESCNACHQDLQFHGGGRRGFATCIACHGTAGAEDRAQYTAPNAPATPGLTINFRTMLHKIHMGNGLANASTYQVVGFGAGAFPDNYSVSTFGDVEFPVMPGGVAQCVKCHGEGNQAWLAPQPRNHPTAQGRPALVWSAACGSCHDSDAAIAHIQVQTSPAGEESCITCHGGGREWPVELMHKVR
jgi:OmcA/MtrC family decaheme c-type cytochrome